MDQQSTPSRPSVLVLAGSDCSGGAGLQADLHTCHAFSCRCHTVATALTAQNSRRFASLYPVSPAYIDEQLLCCLEDNKPDVVKIGMTGHIDILEHVISVCERHDLPVVWDPVLRSTTGGALRTDRAEDWLDTIEKILPHIAVVTPNLGEAEWLCRCTCKTADDIMAAAAHLQQLGAACVVIKGGHGVSEISCDYVATPTRSFWMNAPRLATQDTHGTGCTFASAMASALAKGYTVEDAAVMAKIYIQQALHMADRTELGNGPVWQGLWPVQRRDAAPWISCRPALATPVFAADCGPRPIGLFPYLSSEEEIKPLADEGITMMQLRLSDAIPAGERNARLCRAIATAAACDVRLFINDFWEEAIYFGAYGVHLGRADMEKANVDTIHAAGLRLGASCHSFVEMAEALRFGPSYLTMGTVFPSRSKPGLKQHLGLARLKAMAAASPVPAIAIGGIHLDHVHEIIGAGVHGAAVISAVPKGAQAAADAARWNAQPWPVIAELSQ
ncbi:MAG: bifunctional hydroxymethylpyrimidine kinase/phosphomethylpyrimidine kinase [Spartobacteria bacterium]|nr:bifunctional hydroxymethylpyrimidine kinase/phosphomethylpyrimidine kinase [Spartobacteria bacterium]